MDNYDIPLIKLEDFEITIKNEKIIENVNLEIFPGETVLIYGPRDSGKSILLRSFVHLNEELFNEVNAHGGIFFSGKDVRELDRRFLRSQITYIDTSFVENMNFLNLKELLFLSLGMKISDIKKDHYEILNKLGIAKFFSDMDNLKKYSELKDWSIAEKISLITFISLARNPKVFIFDCILDHLDDFLLREVKNILFNIKSDRTMIISTRNLSLFSDLSDKILFLDSGKVKYYGKTENFIINYI